MKGRILQEGHVGSLPNALHNYTNKNLSTPSFVHVKQKDNHDRNIRRGGVTPDANYHIPHCDDTDGSSNFLKKLYRSMQALVGITSHDKILCLRYEKVRRFKQHFVHMVQSNLSVGKTRVCLIDTGVDLHDEVVGQFVRIYKGEHSKGGDNRRERNGGGEYGAHVEVEEQSEEESFPSWAYANGGEIQYDGINTERCNEKNYARCESSDVDDVDLHGTFIANTIIRREVLIKRETYKRDVELIVCKAFGDTHRTNSHLMPLIKCLEHCKERAAKVIHVGYNVQGESEKLVEVMEELARAEIVVVSPSLQVYGGEGGEVGTTKEQRKDYSTQKIMYPSSFANMFENVFSVGALRNSPQGGLVPISGNAANAKGEKQKGEQLHKRENTTLFSFSYGKTFPFGRSPSWMVEDGPGYASADFVNTLVMIFNVNPKLPVRRLRHILKRSIVRSSELKGLSKWGGYIELFKVIEATLKERNELCKNFLIEEELDLDLEAEDGSGSFAGVLSGDEEQPSFGEAITGEGTPPLDAASEEGTEDTTSRLEEEVIFPPHSGEMEEIEMEIGGETLRGLDSEDVSYGMAALSEDFPRDTTYTSMDITDGDVYELEEEQKSLYEGTGGGLSSLPLGFSFLDDHPTDEGRVPPLHGRKERGHVYGFGEGTSFSPPPAPRNRRSLSERGFTQRWDEQGTHAMNETDSGDGPYGQADWVTQRKGTKHVHGPAYDEDNMYGNWPQGIPAGELLRADWGGPTPRLSRGDGSGETSSPWGDEMEGYAFSPQLDDNWGERYGRRRRDPQRRRARDKLRRRPRRRGSPRAMPRQRRRIPTRGRTTKRFTRGEDRVVRKNGRTGQSRNGNAMRSRRSEGYGNTPGGTNPVRRHPVRAFTPKKSRVVMGRR
ncbi:hypothetical protein AK88_01529 [Plasmodium fragile]|uniref:subtilisin n=1 Tax=Plasmodium fragile TaxID=5857 RepID=A0A0D9QP59_PLAFR|nr:uncharacterized protein AK88_01529 [Plasmodium fragile]KJP88839.1 hypothetical protein AK88_01529 [Plasmodium fragile]